MLSTTTTTTTTQMESVLGIFGEYNNIACEVLE
jgi:hypothetical protein